MMPPPLPSIGTVAAGLNSWYRGPPMTVGFTDAPVTGRLANAAAAGRGPCCCCCCCHSPRRPIDGAGPAAAPPGAPLRGGVGPGGRPAIAGGGCPAAGGEPRARSAAGAALGVPLPNASSVVVSRGGDRCTICRPGGVAVFSGTAGFLPASVVPGAGLTGSDQGSLNSPGAGPARDSSPNLRGCKAGGLLLAVWWR